MKLRWIALLLLSACGAAAFEPAVDSASASRADGVYIRLRRLIENKLLDKGNQLVDVPKDAKPPDAVLYELSVVNARKGPDDTVSFLEPIPPSGVDGYVIEVLGPSRTLSINHY